MKKFVIDIKFLYLFIPLSLLEIIFRFVQYGGFDFLTIVRAMLFIFAFSELFSYLINLLKSKKVYFWVGLIIVLWFCIYSFVELIFKNFMGDFYSFGTAGDGLTRVSQYIVLFISNAKISYYLVLLPLVVYIVLHIFCKNLYTDSNIILDLGFFFIPAFILIIIFDVGVNDYKVTNTYLTFNNKDVLVDKLGITHFFFRDISALRWKKEEVIEIDPVEKEEVVITDYSRKIDDTNWKSIMNNETNEDLKTLDNYLMSQTITDKNDHTGIYEGYNFIYFLVESGDYLMIDKDLTPTLYKMYKDGSSFYNHYTPLYSCGTGESEMVSYVSIFPYVDTCTPNYEQDTYFYEALPYLFKNEGYSTMAFHNWRDEWYERNELLNHMGIDEYYDIDAIMEEDPSVSIVYGWQSDKMLVEHAWDHINKVDGNYFAMIISSTMHFPYDEYSYYGDLYLDEVNAVHPDWEIDYKRYMSKSIEYDKALEYLLEKLEESNQLDNTVICMYCDHRPYWLDYDKVFEYTSWINQRNEYSGYGDGEDEKIGVYRSPFIIYNANQKAEVNYNYCSTMDHVPTIANLFNLKYDPRLYIGKDIYSGSNIVIFSNGDWLSEYGIYDSSKELFTPNEKNKDKIKEDYSAITNKKVQQQIKVSHKLLLSEYFQNRKSICYPNYE